MPSQTFDSNGTFTWPVAVYNVSVECFGAGGGGAYNAGTGGGGGGYAVKYLAKSGATDTVTVGTGGSGGTNSTSDTDGGDTHFRNSSTVLAKGGLCGTNGGTGGLSGSEIGDTVHSGGNGDITPDNSVGGGGGGCAGNANDGSSGAGQSGGAGGSNGGGNGGNGGDFDSNGSNGTAPGGGGGGSGFDNGANPIGGNGANGRVVITWNAGSLVFTQQPTNALSGAIISPAITVEIRTDTNTLDTSFNGSVTIAILNNPNGGTLNGTTTVSASSGVATFSDLSINVSSTGEGYTLQATSTDLDSATSNPFNITFIPLALNRFIFQSWIKRTR